MQINRCHATPVGGEFPPVDGAHGRTKRGLFGALFKPKLPTPKIERPAFKPPVIVNGRRGYPLSPLNAPRLPDAPYKPVNTERIIDWAIAYPPHRDRLGRDGYAAMHDLNPVVWNAAVRPNGAITGVGMGMIFNEAQAQHPPPP